MGIGAINVEIHIARRLCNARIAAVCKLSGGIWGAPPIHYRFLKRIGLERLRHDMKYLGKKILMQQEWLALRVALGTISSIQEAPMLVECEL